METRKRKHKFRELFKIILSLPPRYTAPHKLHNKMEKDNRSKEKRSRMRSFKKNHYQNISHAQNSANSKTGRPAAAPETVRGVIDVADSSDDRFTYRSSQWSEQSDDDEHNNNQQMSAGDFGVMQNLPTGGGHFVFSSEKIWENDDNEIFDKSEASSYFTLNLKLLNAGLHTIPFYKRMDFPGIFDKHELKLMNLEAENAEKQYQEILQKHEQNIKSKPSATKNRSGSGKSQKSEKNSVIPTKPNPAPTPPLSTDKLPAKSQNDDVLDELLTLTTNNVAKVSFKDTTEITPNPDPISGITDAAESKINSEQPKNIEIGNKEDIQQWLDDILE